jgi:hypothetical protein
VRFNNPFNRRVSCDCKSSLYERKFPLKEVLIVVGSGLFGLAIVAVFVASMASELESRLELCRDEGLVNCESEYDFFTTACGSDDDSPSAYKVTGKDPQTGEELTLIMCCEYGSCWVEGLK